MGATGPKVSGYHWGGGRLLAQGFSEEASKVSLLSRQYRPTTFMVERDFLIFDFVVRSY